MVADKNEPDQEVSFQQFQQLIHKMYFEKDAARGIEGTFMWLMEEAVSYTHLTLPTICSV